MTQPDARTLLSTLAAPALVCTRGGTVVDLNTAAATWLDTSAGAVAGRSLGALLHVPRESVVGFAERCSRHGHGVCTGQVYRGGDRSRGSAMSCHAQRLLGTRPAGCLLLVFAEAARRTIPVPPERTACGPITPAGRAGEARRTDAAPLHDPGALGEIALGLVHEANQPLTAIATYAHSCRRWLNAGRGDHPKLIPTLDKIIEQVHATGRMIGGLKGLVHARDDAPAACDLNALVSESLDLLALDPRAERCTIESRPEADTCPVLVSPVQIQLVLMNLLRNAVEASLATEGAEPRVRVSVATDEGWACATVSDSGAGVTRAASAQLFEPVVSSKANGLGLGLAICRWLAVANAGRIDYRPGVPHGASFRLFLPIAR